MSTRLRGTCAPHPMKPPASQRRLTKNMHLWLPASSRRHSLIDSRARRRRWCPLPQEPARWTARRRYKNTIHATASKVQAVVAVVAKQRRRVHLLMNNETYATAVAYCLRTRQANKANIKNSWLASSSHLLVTLKPGFMSTISATAASTLAITHATDAQNRQSGRNGRH